MISGIYYLRAGSHFYIGSSSDFRKRRSQHAIALRKGTHPCAKLQAAFAEHGTARLEVAEEILRHPGETTKEFRTRLRAAEQILLDSHREDPLLCNKSPSAFGPNNGELMKELWKTPEHRQKMASVTRHPTTPATRKRMAKAKQGASNPKARALTILGPNGLHEFPTVQAAAEFFHVSQQVMDLWVRGIVQWPTSGGRTRRSNRWIADYRIVVLDPDDL